MEIRTRLRQVRKTLELTQVEFAALAGVQENALVLYEAGKRTPRSPFFAKLNEHGIDVSYILYGTSETRYAEKLSEDEERLIRNLRSMHPDAAKAIVLAVTAMSTVRHLQDAGFEEVAPKELQPDDGERDATNS